MVCTYGCLKKILSTDSSDKAPLVIDGVNYHDTLGDHKAPAFPSKVQTVFDTLKTADSPTAGNDALEALATLKGEVSNWVAKTFSVDDFTDDNGNITGEVTLVQRIGGKQVRFFVLGKDFTGTPHAHNAPLDSMAGGTVYETLYHVVKDGKIVDIQTSAEMIRKASIDTDEVSTIQISVADGPTKRVPFSVERDQTVLTGGKDDSELIIHSVTGSRDTEEPLVWYVVICDHDHLEKIGKPINTYFTSTPISPEAT